MELVTEEETKRRKAAFFTVLVLGVLILPVVFIGGWSGISDFRTAFIHGGEFNEAI
ncbi:MAG: hypothetical protein NC314_05825 [Roseburia sp.]|nr:hypothetical protein [Roseburia sp.]MCM1242342.1 hypothetical protein [Roseburia sp.]